jgi:biotin transport system substrate-specific component
MISLGLTLPQAIVGGVLPFVFGDVIKAIAAAALLPLAWKLIR